MSKRTLFTKPIHLLFFVFTLALFVTSCSKEEIITPTDENVDISSYKGDFNFFNTLGSDFEGLFPEDVWQLLNSNPTQAMIELTGVDFQAPLGQEVVWIPYLAYTDADYELSPITEGNEFVGIQAYAEGEGHIYVDLFGNHQVEEGTTQLNSFEGDVGGASGFDAEDFGLSYDIVRGLASDKEKSGLLDAVLLQIGQSGQLSGSVGGFAVRKSDVSLPDGPGSPNQSVEGSTSIVTLGYLAFID